MSRPSPKSELPRLIRAAPPAPVRVLHLGLGAFHRAHQAWYTHAAADSGRWGIAAFTGRTPQLADALRRQDGLYTLVERQAGDSVHTIVRSISRVHSGDDLEELTELLCRSELAVVTLTVTEAGYHLDQFGQLDTDSPRVLDDVAELRHSDGPGRPSTPLGRLLLGLRARWQAKLPAVAVVPCDNMPDNGARVARACRVLATLAYPEDSAWVDDVASFVSTSVDRITPRVTAQDIAAVESLTGYRDAAPVITEPFSDWVLAGTFPGGRPDWESAGARTVADISPWEKRKLWMLNGAHTLLAVLGRERGLTTVAQAVADVPCRVAVERFWDDAERSLPTGVEVEKYRASLVERFANPAIEHRLDQIAEDEAAKIRHRIVPVALAELSAGRLPFGAAYAISRCSGIEITADLTSVRSALADLHPALAAHKDFVDLVATISSASSLLEPKESKRT